MIEDVLIETKNISTLIWPQGLNNYFDRVPRIQPSQTCFDVHNVEEKTTLRFPVK